ncbi:MAG: glycosyltransferase family 39 protein [Elusimicrobiota bacterium]|nr:glycosyltransferase family 39 protein [Elusimicrobiota bacterium]
MPSRATDRRAAFFLALGLVLAGGALRFQQAWSYREAYLPDAAREEGYYEAGIGLLSYQAYSVGVPNDRPHSWRGPIYPTFIALVESFSPEPSPARVRMTQAVLSTFGIILVFALGAAIHSPAAGLVAAALLAFDLRTVEAVTSLNIHGFYSFLLLAACAALALWSERPTAKSTFLCGAFIGFTLLCRSAHFLLVPLAAAAAWFWRPWPGPRWGAPALLVLGAALALAPMTARNRAVTGRWLIFPDTNAGAMALFATTMGRGLENVSVERALEFAEAAEPGFREAHRKEALYPAVFQLALNRIAGDPARFAGQCLRRLGLLGRELWLPLLLGAAGLALLRRNRRYQAAMLAAASFGGYAAAGGGAEHQSAILPVLFLVSGCGAAACLDRLRGRAATAPPELRGWPRGVLAAAVGLGLVLYAAFLFALAVEARRRLWRGDPPSLLREDRALTLLARLAERREEPAASRYRLALSRSAGRWAAQGDCVKAGERLSLARRFDPRLSGGAATLAACRAAAADPREARAIVESLRARPPAERAEFREALNRLADARPRARAASAMADADVRAEDFEHALERLAADPRPDDADALIAKARARAGLGQKRAAEALLEKAAALSPGREQRHAAALLYQDMKQYDRARALFGALAAEHPGDPSLLTSLAACEHLSGASDRAEDSLQEALRTDPSFLPAYLTLGYIYEERGLHDRAAALYTRALSVPRAVDGDPMREGLRLALRRASAANRE